MRRADRLFKLVQCLHPKRVTTAAQLAETLEVSERTIYRDIQDLSVSGVPIVSEAGIGYRLMPGFQLPPLMFDEVELEAILLGVRMVSVWSDRELAKSARHALKKIEAVLPDSLKPQLDRNEILVPDFPVDSQISDLLYSLRTSIKKKLKIHIQYTREDGTQSNRIVQPSGCLYWGKVWTLVGWCELRDDFRHFRLDRISSFSVTTCQFADVEERSMNYYLSHYADCHQE